METEEAGCNVRNTPQLKMCCVCGVLMSDSPARMCMSCLRADNDPTADIPRYHTLSQCRNCLRFQKPPWMKIEWESREMLALCLRRLKGLSSVRLTDASLLYTEPNSKRVKVKLVVQQEVSFGAILEAPCIVEFTIEPLQCEDCRRSFTPHTWQAMVQLRQRVPHKKTLMYLEQLILRHQAHEHATHINKSPDGIDLQFLERCHAERFAAFVHQHLPVKAATNKKLVSHNEQNNTANQKFTIALTIAPVCRDDLVCLSPKAASGKGGISPFLLVTKVSNHITLLDPFSMNGVLVASEKYWQTPFYSVTDRRHLTTFIVLDIEAVAKSEIRTASVPNRFLDGKGKGKLVDVEIARLSDFGANDQRTIVRTHLGSVLRPMCLVVGYDLRTLQLSGATDDATNIHDKIRYDVVLVKRIFPPKDPEKRTWALDHISSLYFGGGDDEAEELEEFKQELEMDIDLRRGINLYKNPRYKGRKGRKGHRETDGDESMRDEETTEAEDDEDDRPEVDIAELLEAMTLEDAT